MTQSLATIIDLREYPLHSDSFRAQSIRTLDEFGALVMPGFLKPAAIRSIKQDGADNEGRAYYTVSKHNIYLQPADERFPADHPRNREVCSSKGCITTDQVPVNSLLHTLYKAEEFRGFLCAMFGEKQLFEYADPLSSINLHYAQAGQELGWHFDNSSFAVTLMIHEPEGGGKFEYVRDVRDADSGDMNYELAGKVLDGEIESNTLEMGAGTLVLFRGRDTMHRVTPVEGELTRMLVVFAYNTEPDISLSESARMTFFGRLG